MDFKLLQTKKGKIITSFILLIYLLLLVRVILFKYPLTMILAILKSNEISLLKLRLANSNFVPLKTIFYYLFVNWNVAISLRSISLRNLLGNIIAFLPLGFLLPVVFYRITKIRVILLSSFALSLTFEVIQLLTGIGDFDVDDILLNMLGSICGYVLYRVFCLLDARHRSGTKKENDPA